jgi:hypothetical protein
MSFESTLYHEAGHAALFLLTEDVFGAPRMISVLPYGDSAGFILPSGEALTDYSPRAIRAYGRILTAGGIAQCLAGLPADVADDLLGRVFLGHGSYLLSESRTLS